MRPGGPEPLTVGSCDPPPGTTPACAHAVIRLKVEQQGETARAHWACETCGAPFAPTLQPIEARGAVDQSPTREYLSVAELARLVPYSEGSIRNLMSQGRLRLGIHYVKPRGRVMFRWSAMRAWLDGQEGA